MSLTDRVLEADTSEVRAEPVRARHVGLGLTLLFSASLYRPLILWADNAWEVASPMKLLLIGLLVWGVAVVAYALLVRLRMRPAPAAVAVTGLVIAAMNWHRLAPHPLLWLVAFGILAGVIQRFVASHGERNLLTIGVAVLLIAPVAQLILAHIQRSEPYPIVDLAERHPAEATGLVEDVIVVVVDNYPSLQYAAASFSHDTSDMRNRLSALGYTVEPNAWSQHSFTGLTVPSLLELQPIVEPGPKGAWGHRMSTYSIIRGDSLVATTLRSAGFEYTHVESGWHAGACGNVDVCLRSSWLDEETWELLRPGIASTAMEERLGWHTVGNSIRVVDHLESVAESFGDGQRDFVFAHLLIPHPPLVVDSRCNVLSMDARNDPASKLEAQWAEQLSCADSLIERVAQLGGPESAVIITGDHGTANGGQNSKPVEEWTDADIAERLGVFLAYRLPTGCDSPEDAVNTDVMRAIMSCTVTAELPERDARFMIGANDPMVVDSETMARIRAAIDRGTIPGS